MARVYPGLEERCEEVIEELEEADGVLCVDSLLDLVRIGGRSPIDSVGAFFIPYLKSGELRMITEAAPPELDACQRLLPGLADQFRILRVEPLEKAAALSLLSRMADNARATHTIDMDREVLDLVHRMFARFYPYSRGVKYGASRLRFFYSMKSKKRRRKYSTFF